MTVKCLSLEEKQTVLEMFRNGESKTDIAMEFEVSSKTVYRVLIEAGEISFNWRSEIKLSKAEADLIQHIRRLELNPAEMCHVGNITMAHVHKYFKKLSEPHQKSILQLLSKELQQQKQVA